MEIEIEFLPFLWLSLSSQHRFIGNDTVKSKIEIDPATQMDAGIYECTADNQYSVDRRSFKTDFSIAFDWDMNILHKMHSQELSTSNFLPLLSSCSIFPLDVICINHLDVNKKNPSENNSDIFFLIL